MCNTKPTPEEIHSALLSSAKSLFLEKGIAGTEMKEIAAQSGLSRSTLYRYAIDRNRLAFMVSAEVLTELTEKCLSIAMENSMTGFQKLRQFAHHFIDTLCENVSVVRFLNEFDCIFTTAYPDIPEATEYTETMSRMLHRSAQFMFEGLVDGSIRPNGDPLHFVSVLVNTIFGLGKRLLPRNEHYIQEHNAQARDIIVTAVNILLDSIKVDGASN